MSKSTVTPVSAQTIRLAARAGEVTLTDAALACVLSGPQGQGRGRLNSDLVQAFLDTHPGTSYGEKSKAEVKTVVVPFTKVSKAGATLKRPQPRPIAEVRKALGIDGKVGRISKANLAKAAELLS